MRCPAPGSTRKTLLTHAVPVNFNSYFPTDPATNEHVDVQADHYKVVREIGAAGTVLLKNVGGALPLKAPKFITIISM